jgi:hypothetical protein
MAQSCLTGGPQWHHPGDPGTLMTAREAPDPPRGGCPSTDRSSDHDDAEDHALPRVRSG